MMTVFFAISLLVYCVTKILKFGSVKTRCVEVQVWLANKLAQDQVNTASNSPKNVKPIFFLDIKFEK